MPWNSWVAYTSCHELWTVAPGAVWMFVFVCMLYAHKRMNVLLWMAIEWTSFHWFSCRTLRAHRTFRLEFKLDFFVFSIFDKFNYAFSLYWMLRPVELKFWRHINVNGACIVMNHNNHALSMPIFSGKHFSSAIAWKTFQYRMTLQISFRWFII